MTIETATHKDILLRLLKDIFTNTEINAYLGFKGGTAAFLFYGLDRFSVDLDFDILDTKQEDKIFRVIGEIAEQYGILKDNRKKRFSFFYLLSYENKMQNAHNIKIEINRRDFGSRYEPKVHLGISIPVMRQEDMAAHKLVAMVERKGKATRDIYDVNFFLKNNWPINFEIVKNRTNLSAVQFLKQSISMLETLNNRHILSGLGELLNTKQKAWVKEKLLDETIFLLKLKLDTFK